MTRPKKNKAKNNNNNNNNNKQHKDILSKSNPNSPPVISPVSDQSSPTTTDSDQSREISPTSPDMDTHHPHLISHEYKQQQISPRVRETSPHKKYNDVDVIQPVQQQQQHAREEKEKSKMKSSKDQREGEGEGQTITTSRPTLVTPSTHETMFEQTIPQQHQQQQQHEQPQPHHAHTEKAHEPNMEEKIHVAQKSTGLENMGTIRRVIVSLLVIGFSASTASTDLGLSLLSSLCHRIWTYIFLLICGENNVFWTQFHNQQDITHSHVMEPSLTPSWFSFHYITFRMGLMIKHIDRLIYELITTSRVATATSLIPTFYLRVLSWICPEDAHDLLYKHQLEQMHDNQYFHWKSLITLIRVMTPWPTMELPMPKPVQGLI